MNPILAPATLGLLGGGQLGRFFVGAAHELGYAVYVLDPDPDSPAGRIADQHICAAYDDRGALSKLAAGCAAVTTEFENVPAASLEYLATAVQVFPGAAAVATCQDRIAEKAFLAEHGLPHGPYLPVTGENDIGQADATLFPGILKRAHMGYDGKGQVRVSSRADALTAFRHLGRQPCVLEALLPLEAEISVVLARDGAGNVAVFPPAENSHRDGILDISIVPARVSDTLAAEARTCAQQIAAHMGYVGTLAIEFFVSAGKLRVNEMAPRPHNSGHATIDACATSQYEQQVRSLCGLPLGDPTPALASVMVNLLGDLWHDGEPDWQRLLRIPGLKLHLYGKRVPRPGRKMGHYTVIGNDPAEVLATALRARAELGMPD